MEVEPLVTTHTLDVSANLALGQISVLVYDSHDHCLSRNTPSFSVACGVNAQGACQASIEIALDTTLRYFWRLDVGSGRGVTAATGKLRFSQVGGAADLAKTTERVAIVLSAAAPLNIPNPVTLRPTHFQGTLSKYRFDATSTDSSIPVFFSDTWKQTTTSPTAQLRAALTPTRVVVGRPTATSDVDQLLEIVKDDGETLAVRSHTLIVADGPKRPDGTNPGAWSSLHVPGAGQLVDAGMVDGTGLSGRRKDLWLATIASEQLVLCLFTSDATGQFNGLPGCQATDQFREGSNAAWIALSEAPGRAPIWAHSRSSDGWFVARALRWNLSSMRLDAGEWFVSTAFSDNTGPQSVVGALLPGERPGFVRARPEQELLVVAPLAIDPTSLRISALPEVRTGMMMAEGGVLGLGRLAAVPMAKASVISWFRTDHSPAGPVYLVAKPVVPKGNAYSAAPAGAIGLHYGETTTFVPARWSADSPGFLYAYTRTNKLQFLPYRWDPVARTFGAVAPTPTTFEGDPLGESNGRWFVGAGQFDSTNSGEDAWHYRTEDGIPFFRWYQSDSRGRLSPRGLIRLWR
jgi:hypothetical protein